MSESTAAAPAAEPSDSGAEPAGAGEGVSSCGPKLPPRVARWCSMLLDLSRRNRLLNFKDGPGAVRLAFDAPERLEDAITGDKVYRVLETPEKGPRIAALFTGAAQGGAGVNDANANANANAEATEAREFLKKAFEDGRLYALSGGAGNAHKRLLALFRVGRNDLEEGGVRTLHLAFGALKWRDGKGASAPVYRAPLVLCPVELRRLPGHEGFALKRTDDDPVANATLLEMLRREQRIEVPGADPMPEDEHGLDLAKVFAAYRDAVAPLAGWSVEPEVWVGRFSFNKFLMWRDLSTRLDDLAQSPVVAHLLSGEGAFDDGVAPVAPNEVDALSDEGWPPCPVAADSSQLSAVLAAVRGRNFVLHGPPGTGKSQTITNLIACCMAAGKTVLFVAEKRAALEVVQRRLRKIGLSPFCLELHSNKAGKAEVLRQFKESLDYGGAQPPEAWDATLSDLRATRRSLDGVVAALHRVHPCGLTPYRAFSHLLAHAGDAAAEGLSELGGAPLSEGAFADSLARAESLAAAARDVPDELFDAFGPIGATEWTPAWADALAAAAKPFAPAVRELCRLAFPEGTDAETFWPVCEAALLRRERGLAGLEAFSRAWPGFDVSAALALNASALRAAWDDLPNRFFLTRPFRRRAVRKALLAAAAKGVPPPSLPSGRVPELLDALDALRAAHEDSLALDRDRFGAPKGADERIPEGWADGVIRAWEAYRPVAESFRKAAQGPAPSERALPDEAPSPNPAALLVAAEKVLALASERRAGLREWCRFRAAAAACADAGLAPLADAVESGALAPDNAVEAARTRYCERFVRAALDADATLRDFFGNGQDALVERFGQLDATMASLSRDMVLARLTLGLVKARRDRALSAELSLLNHEVAKKTRQKPPRLLLESIPGLLPVLKPCLLMSPLSVAQYLPAGQSAFDVVVFDEASQLTVWDAVGALARGRQAVVVGDPKQLPPTNFFQKGDGGESGDDETDEGQEDVRDLDSILDECRAAGVPEQALLWHYRSRHESLIAFSNERYYDGLLYTFPSAAVARKGLGVRRVRVDGVYDRSRTRTNRMEAEAVVAAVVERLLDPAFADKTCGVVTFSMAQQGLIEDLLDEEQAKHPEIQRFFDPALPEPFFVKNLENVQGDERDAIFFSIGYAPDETGRFAMNFGPLNRPGGERRLNVAVTRAKEEVVVFTSIESTQIDLSRTAALGAAHLREFLSYAERAESPAPSAAAQGAAADGPPREFENEVAEFLRCRGYEVDERVGRSGYRIDLAVRSPKGDGSYAIAVECDGATYRDASSARDRDVSRRGVLEGLGWRVARCWCLEWWFDRERAEAKLLAEVSAAVRGEPPPETGSQVPKFESSKVPAPPAGEPSNLRTFEPSNPCGASASGEGAALADALREAKDAPDECERAYVAGEANRDYAKAQSNFNDRVGLPFLREQILRIVNAEGPIAEELLAARVFDEWGIRQPTSQKLAVFRKGVPDTLPVTTHQRRKVYWPVDADPSAWHFYRVPTDDPRTHRSFAQIPFEEVVAALEAAGRALGPSAAADDLFRDALRRFGLPARITADARPVLEAARKVSVRHS